MLYNKYLQDFIDNRVFVKLYTERYNESFFGFIFTFTDDFLLFENYNNNSMENGIIVFYRENITKIRWEGNELNHLQKLIKTPRISGLEKIELYNIQTIISSVQLLFGHINIYTEDIDDDVCYIGEVDDLDDFVVVLNEFGNPNTSDRKKVLINIHNITKVEANGIYEKNLLEIYDI